jgi:hypothetical protein
VSQEHPASNGEHAGVPARAALEQQLCLQGTDIGKHDGVSALVVDYERAEGVVSWEATIGAGRLGDWKEAAIVAGRRPRQVERRPCAILRLKTEEAGSTQKRQAQDTLA